MNDKLLKLCQTKLWQVTEHKGNATLAPHACQVDMKSPVSYSSLCVFLYIGRVIELVEASQTW